MDELSQTAAEIIRSSFVSYHSQFQAITCHAKQRFEQCEWQRTRQNQYDRLNLYNTVVDPCVIEVCDLLGTRVDDKTVWADMKAAFEPLIARRPDCDIAETFFNSVTRRVFSTVGVDKKIEFVDFEATLQLDDVVTNRKPVSRSYRPKTTTSDLVKAILTNCRFAVDFDDLDRDAALIAAEIDSVVPNLARVDMVKSIFYRGRSGYLIGRISSATGSQHADHFTPLIIALQNGADGIYIDTVLLTENEASILFSFTRSYFHVVCKRPYKMIAFLKSIMPLKPISELYISLGYNKHGKTVFYRELMRHMAYTDDKFEIARGERGMVMIVFALPSMQVVFKLIKDKFDYPKTSTRDDVMACYKLVFNHDRAGRLIDAQEFEHLAFPRDRFQPELLAELLEVAGNTVSLNGDDMVSISHLYTERQITPLNLYLAENEGEAVRNAALDYGQAIKDLAATNIFPGDLFLKNFGVTRHGRVIFYDYDELLLVTDCRFRRIPPPRSWEDEISDQPWFTIRPNDVFPEQFVSFIGLPPDLKQAFIAKHSDLFEASYWRDLKAQHNAGIVPEIFPYKREKQFRY
jgi:isocitrate dehydrogenase kinase/phosphatase